MEFPEMEATGDVRDEALEDARIIDLYFARNEQAIRETETAYGRYCYGIALRILGSPADAEECVNDTYLRTWNSIPPKRPQALRAYLAHIVRNVAISRYRQYHAAKRNAGMEVSLTELSECLPAPDSGEHGTDAELRETLNAFVRALDETDRRLFVGRYWHGYAVSELARAYGMRENTVSQRLYRIRERLRRHLTERGYTV